MSDHISVESTQPLKRTELSEVSRDLFIKEIKRLDEKVEQLQSQFDSLRKAARHILMCTNHTENFKNAKCDCYMKLKNRVHKLK